MEAIRQTQKKYCYRAMVTAIALGGFLILIGQQPVGKGFILGTIFSVVNFVWGMVGALIAPMVLGFTSSQDLGAIISIAGAGLLIGSLVMSIWGGPQRRVKGVLLFEALSGLFFVLIGLRPSFWSVAARAASFST